uniref:Uncharacterized protein n=1 Tax=Oryza rufipogon TaxID=4529 RepID=A0A0E0MU44_ORYRU
MAQRAIIRVEHSCRVPAGCDGGGFGGEDSCGEGVVRGCGCRLVLAARRHRLSISPSSHRSPAPPRPLDACRCRRWRAFSPRAHVTD